MDEKPKDHEESLLTQSAILEVLQHQTIADIRKHMARHRLHAQLWNSLLFLIAACLAIGGFYLGWMSNAKEAQNAQYRDYLQRRDTQIDQVIAAKFDWMMRAEKAVMELRNSLTYFNPLPKP